MGMLFLLTNTAWVTAAILAVLFLAVVLYTVLYLRALAPRRGTLEWVALYDRPALTPVWLPRVRVPEILGVLALAIVAAGIYFCFAGLSLGSFSTAFRELGNGMALSCGIFALQSAAVYVLLRVLTGNPLVSIIVSLLPAFGIFADGGCVLALTLCMIPLACWLRLDADEPARAGFLPLGFFALACAVSVQLIPALCIPEAFLVLAFLAALCLRFHETRRADRLLQFLLSLLLFVLVWAIASVVTLALITAPTAETPDFLRDGWFYYDALTPWEAIPPLRPHPAYALMTNPLTLLLGLIGAIVSIYAARRYGYTEALLLPAAMAGVTVLLFCGLDAVEAAAIPVLGCMTARLVQRRRPVLAWIAVGAAFAFALVCDLLMVLA